MLELGTPAPDFSLPDPVGGGQISLADLPGDAGLLVMFICNHCPYVKHLADALADLGREYQTRRLAIVAISANDASARVDDGPEAMRVEHERRGYPFPYLYDESQAVAKAYRAACTPDFFLFDANHHLVYRGQFDGSRPGNDVPVTGKDLRQAIDAMLDGQPVVEAQSPSMGCNIKWKAGNEPDYYGG